MSAKCTAPTPFTPHLCKCFTFLDLTVFSRSEDGPRETQRLSGTLISTWLAFPGNVIFPSVHFHFGGFLGEILHILWLGLLFANYVLPAFYLFQMLLGNTLKKFFFQFKCRQSAFSIFLLMPCEIVEPHSFGICQGSCLLMLLEAQLSTFGPLFVVWY